MDNETFILQVRGMISVLDTLRQSLSAEIQKLDETAKRLEDSSHLGSASAFDFGLEDQSAAMKRVKKEISKASREVKRLSKDLEAAQSKKIAEQSGSLTDKIEDQ
ncbi:MAG: hypothetical protein A3G34_05855 [Candidatus Lindowbacteria bacterium RIFCSPLOWO2_12_FULL_62_27]|nr:MAG: hypothetical protein A3I06_02405 [Candidatus Lindowbacteria bacterium RIFCSPLOWO2_02_FULL_62_12]OGH59978.1 MAG: hypothetical protein A3G34_05855 [Candidatus Lindowbacteria bacterium RIFCSPLOWO2_12_FULL_62_27]